MDGRFTQAGIYLFKLNIRNANKIYQICSKFTIKTRHSGFFIANFEQISYLVLVFP